MHCPPPPTLEVLESVLAKRGLGLRRELVTPSVRTQQCSLSRDQRRCATCAMRAALAVCERFQHESSSPCYRSSGGWVECSRLSESAASCGATSSADTTSSSRDLDTEPEKRGDRVQEAFGYLFTADAGVGAGQKRPPRLSYSACSGPEGSRFANWANGLNGLRASWVD